MVKRAAFGLTFPFCEHRYKIGILDKFVKLWYTMIMNNRKDLTTQSDDIEKRLDAWNLAIDACKKHIGVGISFPFLAL